MSDYDSAPLWRSTIGADRFFDLAEETPRWTGVAHYPPSNIVRTGEDHYPISRAAGFTPQDVDIAVQQNP